MITLALIAFIALCVAGTGAAIAVIAGVILDHRTKDPEAHREGEYSRSEIADQADVPRLTGFMPNHEEDL